MLCEGSLATKNVGTFMEEMIKPMKDFEERKETIQELLDKEEFQADEDFLIEGEEDVLLVVNKAATLILVQEKGSWINQTPEGESKCSKTKSRSRKTEGYSRSRKINVG